MLSTFMKYVKGISAMLIKFLDGSEQEISKENLRGVNLRGANLHNADLQGVDLCNVSLCNANLRGADLRKVSFCNANLRDTNLCGANLRSADLRGANLRGADLRVAYLPSPTMVLLAEWKEVSDELCIELMRYDASCHPDPTKFNIWVETNNCPYKYAQVQRAANFKEKKELYSASPSKGPYELMNMLLKEKCNI